MSATKKNFLCWLGAHNLVKIGPIEPLEISDEERESWFISDGYRGHFALGKCKRCGKEEFVRIYGSFNWRGYEEMTEERYLKEHTEYRDEMLLKYGLH